MDISRQPDEMQWTYSRHLTRGEAVHVRVQPEQRVRRTQLIQNGCLHGHAVAHTAATDHADDVGALARAAARALVRMRASLRARRVDLVFVCALQSTMRLRSLSIACPLQIAARRVCPLQVPQRGVP